jgi:LPS-assembly lipoprotein
MSVPSRRVVLAAALLSAALAGGCIQPLYGEHTSSTIGGNVRTALKSIEIPEIKGLVGHYLRNELVFELDGGGDSNVQKRLRLEASITESIEVITVDYYSGRADSAVLVATANWTVKRIDNGQVVASGSNVVRAPYERSAQRFATVRAARDAQVRAAKALAERIKRQLSADLVAG